MIAIVTPVWNSFDLVQQCCDHIDKNTSDNFLHILVDDNSDAMPPIKITTNRFVIGLRNDYAGHKIHIGKALQIGYRFAQDFINFSHFFICESDVMVPPRWDAALIYALKPYRGVIDIYPVDENGNKEYPTNVNLPIGQEDELEEINYADLNACVFNPQMFDGSWGFGDYVSHHDILLSRKWAAMGYKFYRHKQVKAYHVSSGSRKNIVIDESNPGNIFERYSKYG